MVDEHIRSGPLSIIIASLVDLELYAVFLKFVSHVLIERAKVAYPFKRVRADTSAAGSWALSEVGEHGASVVRPDLIFNQLKSSAIEEGSRITLVPVRGDGCTRGNGTGKLESTGCTIIIAGKGCGCRILDGVAESF